MLPDITLAPTRWASRDDTVLIEWTITATFGDERVSWDGADRFTVRGDRAVEGVAYFDTLPIWQKVNPALRPMDLPERLRQALPANVELPGAAPAK